MCTIQNKHRFGVSLDLGAAFARVFHHPVAIHLLPNVIFDWKTKRNCIPIPTTGTLKRNQKTTYHTPWAWGTHCTTPCKKQGTVKCAAMSSVHFSNSSGTASSRCPLKPLESSSWKFRCSTRACGNIRSCRYSSFSSQPGRVSRNASAWRHTSSHAEFSIRSCHCLGADQSLTGFFV